MSRPILSLPKKSASPSPTKSGSPGRKPLRSGAPTVGGRKKLELKTATPTASAPRPQARAAQSGRPESNQGERPTVGRRPQPSPANAKNPGRGVPRTSEMPARPPRSGSGDARPRKPVDGGEVKAERAQSTRTGSLDRSPAGAASAGWRKAPAPKTNRAFAAPPEKRGQPAPLGRPQGMDERSPTSRPPRRTPTKPGVPEQITARSVAEPVRQAGRSGDPRPRKPLADGRETGTPLPPEPARRTTHVAAAGVSQRGPAKEWPRLAKRVSELTQCSRHEADVWIENGWVSVDGVVVNRLGARVNPKAQIAVNAAASKHRSERLTIILNQPHLAARAAIGGTVTSLIRPETSWTTDGSRCRIEPAQLRGLAAVGTLAADEHGMMVLTQDGNLARRLTGGSARLEHEYHLRVEGTMVADGLQRLRNGLTLDGIRMGRANVSWLSDGLLRFVVFDNRKRQIQRLCELVGLRVSDIKRVRMGSVSLGQLPSGRWRLLRPDEHF